MVELFEQRGMGHDDAVEVIKRMAKYKEFFVNIMMTEELSLPVPDPDDDVISVGLQPARLLLAAVAGGAAALVTGLALGLLAWAMG